MRYSDMSDAVVFHPKGMREHQEREVMKILGRSGSNSGSGGIGMYVPAPAPTLAVGKMTQCWDISPTVQLVTGSGSSISGADTGYEGTYRPPLHSGPKSYSWGCGQCPIWERAWLWRHWLRLYIHTGYASALYLKRCLCAHINVHTNLGHFLSEVHH